MISFIICESEKNKRELYIKVMKKFFYEKSDFYKIHEFDKYNSEVQDKIDHVEGIRIYLLNVDQPESDGLKIAKEIRKRGDFLSPIILITSKEKSDAIDKIQNVLFLDIIKQDNDLVTNLLISLKDAYNIVTRNSVFTFSIFDEVYRIPFNDIYYIQKNLNDDSVTIFTKDDSYLDYITIKKIEEIFSKDVRFFKSHRSCILNLYNVISYDKKDNIVVFNNGMTTSLVARGNKVRLAEKLKEYSNDPQKIKN